MIEPSRESEAEFAAEMEYAHDAMDRLRNRYRGLQPCSCPIGGHYSTCDHYWEEENGNQIGDFDED